MVLQAPVTAADFVEVGIGRAVPVVTYNVATQENADIMNNTVRGIEWTLWKRGMLDTRGTCTVAVDKSTFRFDNGSMWWQGDFIVKKGNKTVGNGSYIARYDAKGRQKILQDINAKVYAEQRRRIEGACAGP